MAQAQLLKVLEELSPVRQAEVLDFALFLRERELAKLEYEISDEAAALLREEFAAEDLALAEAGMGGYLARLQHEDAA